MPSIFRSVERLCNGQSEIADERPRSRGRLRTHGQLADEAPTAPGIILEEDVVGVQVPICMVMHTEESVHVDLAVDQHYHVEAGWTHG